VARTSRSAACVEHLYQVTSPRSEDTAWSLKRKWPLYRPERRRSGTSKENEAGGAGKPSGTVLRCRFSSGQGAEKDCRRKSRSGGATAPSFTPTARLWPSDRQVHDRHDALLAPESAYADGGSLEDEGRSAMKSLVVPPFALALSLAGALVHLFKSANYIIRAIKPNLGAGFLRHGLARLPFGRRTNRRGQALLAAVALLAVSAFFLPNQVSRSVAFGYFERQTAANLGVAAAAGSGWVVQAQPFFYPLNEGIRRHVLLGLSYGYTDHIGGTLP